MPRLEPTGRVFLTQTAPRLDTSDAARFGTPVPLFDRSMYPDDADERLVALKRSCWAKMHDFDYRKDKVALVGDPAVIAAVMQFAMAMAGFNPITVLKFDKSQQAYYPIVLDMYTSNMGDTDVKQVQA